MKDFHKRPYTYQGIFLIQCVCPCILCANSLLLEITSLLSRALYFSNPLTSPLFSSDISLQANINIFALFPFFHFLPLSLPPPTLCSFSLSQFQFFTQRKWLANVSLKLNVIFTEHRLWSFSNFCRYFQLEYSTYNWTHIPKNSSIPKPPLHLPSWNPLLTPSKEPIFFLSLRSCCCFQLEETVLGLVCSVANHLTGIIPRRINLSCSWPILRSLSTTTYLFSCYRWLLGSNLLKNMYSVKMIMPHSPAMLDNYLKY